VGLGNGIILADFICLVRNVYVSEFLYCTKCFMQNKIELHHAIKTLNVFQVKWFFIKLLDSFGLCLVLFDLVGGDIYML